VLLGDDILTYLVLAIGGALLVGNLMALVRPPKARADAGEAGQAEPLERPPLARTLVMIGIGLVATVWSVATFAVR